MLYEVITLKNSGRDIVFSVSNTCPVFFAPKIARIANVIRTAGDLKDRWDQDGAHHNIREEWNLHKSWLEVAFEGSPGHYPDPDMLVVGHVSTSGEDGNRITSYNVCYTKLLRVACFWGARFCRYR